jgi:hypothetical protein
MTPCSLVNITDSSEEYSVYVIKVASVFDTSVYSCHHNQWNYLHIDNIEAQFTYQTIYNSLHGTILFDKLTVPQLVKKLPLLCYVTRRFSLKSSMSTLSTRFSYQNRCTLPYYTITATCPPLHFFLDYITQIVMVGFRDRDDPNGGLSFRLMLHVCRESCTERIKKCAGKFSFWMLNRVVHGGLVEWYWQGKLKYWERNII